MLPLTKCSTCWERDRDVKCSPVWSVQCIGEILLHLPFETWLAHQNGIPCNIFMHQHRICSYLRPLSSCMPFLLLFTVSFLFPAVLSCLMTYVFYYPILFPLRFSLDLFLPSHGPLSTFMSFYMLQVQKFKSIFYTWEKRSRFCFEGLAYLT